MTLISNPVSVFLVHVLLLQYTYSESLFPSIYKNLTKHLGVIDCANLKSDVSF